jgi:AraC-like DNA-binding protein
MAKLMEISTRDPERALPTLEEYFPGVRMTNPHGGFALKLVAAEVETLSVVKYRLQSPASSSSADMSDNLTFGQVESGTLGLVTTHQQVDTIAPWLFPRERVDAAWDDVIITALTVSRAAATRMARAQLGSDTATLDFLGTAPVDASHARQWASFVEYTRSALSEETSTLDLPIVRTSAFAHLVGLMLVTFPNTATEAVQLSATPHTEPSSVRRAVVFIEQNAHLPITVEDIARESRLSIRALQYAFQRHLGTTPAAYLRRTRLDGAHHELRRADPTAGATVANIASVWGFAHPGRFATYYRETYGVSPKQTLGG